ncbi:P-loop containing nucleoside triphosphate hydrolase protein [Lepidopterella palustris CBS 459.81]|uniref:ATP-dependent RNA helicase n=1 Tax=Lepidopterella palustris CBS 459.81 TaxID=1314670 RepID=A0A8E2E1E5_9PEZI|nr:P-loop containing nucleoside triphosphate hydrolase protein [Lepidopterella palustris CBS 459.81]
MAAPLFARYIPPKNTAPKPTTTTFPTLAPVEPKSEETLEKKPKRSKDRPKKRKREIEGDAEEQEDKEKALKKHKTVLSKYEKSSKLADLVRESSKIAPEEQTQKDPTPELHSADLTPLPQPAQVPEPDYQPTFSALPPWLAKPIIVSSSTKTPFKDLELDPKLVEKLEKKGYTEALAVQSAVLPMLRPGPQQHIGDICVSAATGSGKTLAYILPMVEGLQGRVVTKLSGLVVVPTRELVAQARTVAEQLCVGTKLKVGTAVGNVSFASEQEGLIKRGKRYDPESAKSLHEKANEQVRTGFVERGGILDDLMDMLPEHIPHYESKVDILICTPGRLVEHLQSTTGFHLRDVRWLVIDEADRLLDQSFQEWVDVLSNALEAETPPDQLSARKKIFLERQWPREGRELTKVVLSATMTKDLSKLGSLKLRRPKLVLVERDENNANSSVSGVLVSGDGDSFELPSTLKEWVIPVGDGLDKPLYLLDVLQTRILQNSREKKTLVNWKKDSVEEDMSSDSDRSDLLSSDSESSESPASSTSEDSDLLQSEESDSENNSSSDSQQHNRSQKQKLTMKTVGASPVESRVLIFTNNNENASRLSHLLSILHPPLKGILGTLTKSSATNSSRKILAAFNKGKIRVLIASDLASRGLDVPGLAHIVNYDLPRSVTNYVHRVGRTARAGKEGQAWTFYTKTEGRWFWNEIARSSAIRRARKVERAAADPEAVSEKMRKTYEAALKELQLAVEGRTGRAIER